MDNNKKTIMNINKNKIGIIGLGYVGLPLAIEFSKFYQVVGFDIDQQRIQELLNNFDRTMEAESIILENLKNLSFSFETKDLNNCDIFIVTVPTPINQFKSPNLTPLIEASKMLGKIIKKGSIIIYESTVYPGCTEEVCIPIIELNSGLSFNKDFFCGYSPERINPGDKKNTLTKIVKVTSGSTPKIADIIDNLYKSIIKAGTFKASSIKVAEASKAIENAQRDVNISFVNELALIFDKLNIDTNEVLEAAATKWNFIKYKPGLVGGHCIGVDPYYLAYKAESLGYYPEVILSGRRINDRMGTFVANKLIKIMIGKNLQILNSKILIMGITFKENCPDVRNTKVIDIRKELLEYGCEVDIVDCWASQEEVKKELGIEIINNLNNLKLEKYTGIILAVSHLEFLNLELIKLPNRAIYDVKGFLPKGVADATL